MRAMYIYGGAIATGLVVAVGSMLVFPPHTTGASVTLPIATPAAGAQTNATPLPDVTPAAVAAVA